MGGIAWAADNWIALLNSGGVIASLLFTAASLRAEKKSRGISNLLAITQNHRELWSELFEHRELRRVLNPQVDLSAKELTAEEETFVTLLILHLHSVYRAMKAACA